MLKDIDVKSIEFKNQGDLLADWVMESFDYYLPMEEYEESISDLYKSLKGTETAKLSRSITEESIRRCDDEQNVYIG